MNWPDWVMAACAVLSVLGSMGSWWSANKSRKARAEAERARQSAGETLTAIKRIAASMESEPLIIEQVEDLRYVLRSTSPEPVSLSQVENLGDFVGLELTLPVVLAPWQSLEFLMWGGWGRPIPPEMVLRATDHGGRDQSVHVPITRS